MSVFRASEATKAVVLVSPSHISALSTVKSGAEGAVQLQISTVTVAAAVPLQALLSVTVTLYVVVEAGVTVTVWVLPVPAGDQTYVS